MSFNMCICLWNHHSQDNEHIYHGFPFQGRAGWVGPSSKLHGESNIFLCKIVVLALLAHLYSSLYCHWGGSSPFDLHRAFPPSPQLEHSSFCLKPTPFLVLWFQFPSPFPDTSTTEHPLSLLNHPLPIYRLFSILKINKNKQKKSNTFSYFPILAFSRSLLSYLLIMARLPEIDVQTHSLYFLTSPLS